MLRLIILWLGVFSPLMPVPAHATGKERMDGVPSDQPARQLAAGYRSLAVHLRTALACYVPDASMPLPAREQALS